MSFQMIHMEVAYRLLDPFEWVKNHADYMLGSVAPDSVHFFPQYNLYLKENSHLWNYGPRWGMTVESDKWRDNIVKFWDAHKNCKNKDYIAGCIEKEDVICQKEHLLHTQYTNKEPVDISEYKYCTEKATMDFLDECVKVISELMKE